MNHGISVICLVYNEEKRIERFIRSFYGFDEIIILDKGSTDRTVDIAREMGVRIINVPYTDRGRVWKAGVDNARYDWVFLLTASDVIHPEFMGQIYEKIDDEGFNQKYTRADVPTTMHTLGLSGPHLHTDWKFRSNLAKRDNLTLEDKVHEEIGCVPDIRYTFPYDREIAVHHLCYESLEQCYERQLRYSKEELRKGLSYKECFKEVLKEIYRGIRVRVWKAGWHGVGTTLFMIGYRIQIFLRMIEKENGDITEIYNEYAKSLLEGSGKEYRNEEYRRYALGIGGVRSCWTIRRRSRTVQDCLCHCYEWPAGCGRQLYRFVPAGNGTEEYRRLFC